MLKIHPFERYIGSDRAYSYIGIRADENREVLTAWGAFGEKQNYGRTIMGVIRSTFVIDAEGRIEKAMYNVRATGHVAKLRKDLKV